MCCSLLPAAPRCTFLPLSDILGLPGSCFGVGTVRLSAASSGAPPGVTLTAALTLTPALALVLHVVVTLGLHVLGLPLEDRPDERGGSSQPQGTA
jgi:hypothetical protein